MHLFLSLLFLVMASGMILFNFKWLLTHMPIQSEAKSC